jgi:hypothetical protein
LNQLTNGIDEGPMNELWEKILSGAIGLVFVLGGWIWTRFQNRADKLEDRVLAIEQSRMTREEFLRGLADWTSDRRTMHEENQVQFREIREDMAKNEKRRSDTEHAILDVVNKLALKQAATEAVEKYRSTRNDR